MKHVFEFCRWYVAVRPPVSMLFRDRFEREPYNQIFAQAADVSNWSPLPTADIAEHVRNATDLAILVACQ
jgi:hypothetical protein